MKNKKSKSIRNDNRPLQIAKKSQIVSPDLENVTPILEFLEQFRQLSDSKAQMKSKLISIKIPEPLLAAFKYKARQKNIPYQSMIKKLMLKWLNES